MSLTPVTRWIVRCDGATPFGQCPEVWRGWLDPQHDDIARYDDALIVADPNDLDAEGDPLAWVPILLDRPALGPLDVAALTAAGWLLVRDGRLLCPRHVTALEYLARAAIDALPDTTRWGTR